MSSSSASAAAAGDEQTDSLPRRFFGLDPRQLLEDVYNAGDDLVCSVATPSTDADGDVVTYSFAWDVDGAAYGGASSTGTTSTVDDADVGGDEIWTCEVTAGDGTGTSGAAVASVTTAPDCWALQLNGTSDYIDTYDIAESRASTFMMWVKPSVTTTRRMGLVTNGGVASHTMSMDINTGGYPQWSASDGVYSATTRDTWSWVIGPTPSLGGVWTHLAGTWNGTTMKLYVNGALVGSIAEGYPMARSYTSRFGMGVLGGAASYFDGTLADIQVYPSELGASDIAAIAATPFTTRAGVEAHYLTGNASLTDSAGSRTAVAHGTTWVNECP
jgi:hypothetical protein